MIELVLVAPEIPGNTGAIIRLCANTGARLHLVEPLGFSLETAQLRRAGLDYHDLANVMVWPTFAECRARLAASSNATQASASWYAATGRGSVRYSDVMFQRDDVLVFGCESRGLDDAVLDTFPIDHQIRIPMQPNNRSLNLANAAAVVAFEAWRQHDFAGGS